MSCIVKNVIYVITCRGCGKYYTGETNNLRKRTTLHNQHIRHENLRMIPVSGHIASCSDNIRKTKRPWNLVYSIGYSSTTNAFIWWPWVDLDHFYDMVKFVSECFCMGESLYSIECSCISKFVLIQNILSTQVSDTGPVVLWFILPCSMKSILSKTFYPTASLRAWYRGPSGW